MSKLKNFTKMALLSVITSNPVVYCGSMTIKDFGKRTTGLRNIEGDEVTLSDERMMGLGGIVAETPIVGSDGITIRTDMFFDILPEDCQNAVLAHEVGHHKVEEANYCSLFRSIKGECAADSYAASVCGKKATMKMLMAIYMVSQNPECLIRMGHIAFNKDPMAKYHMIKKEKS